MNPPGTDAGGSTEFEVVERRLRWKARKFTVLEERVRFADGDEVVREVVRHPGAAVVLPVHEDGDVELVRVWRHAAGGELLEVPAGTLEPGEDPAACAARELEEETGWRAGRLRSLGSFWPSPGVLAESMHLYLADRLEPSTARPEDDERVAPVRVARADLGPLLRDGAITDAKTVLALCLAGLVAVAPRGPGA